MRGPKEGFSVPLKHWLQGEFRTLAGDLISADRLERQGLFQPRTVQRLWAEHQEGSHNHSHILWALVVYQDWHDRWAG